MTNKNQARIERLSVVANDMIDFILKSHPNIREQNKHIAELALIMKEIEDEYHQPILTAWSMLYRIYRQYTKNFSSIKKPTLDEQLLILEVITHFLKHAAKETSSANLILLDFLLAKINQHDVLILEEKFLFASAKVKDSILLELRIALRNVFIYQANKTLARHRKANHEANVIKLNFARK